MTEASIEKGSVLLKEIKRLKDDIHLWKTKGIKISSTGASRLLSIEDANYLIGKFETELATKEKELEDLV